MGVNEMRRAVYKPATSHLLQVVSLGNLSDLGALFPFFPLT
jgi:hypothetical protein